MAKIVYTCPRCGQQAVYGEHFCGIAGGIPAEPRPDSDTDADLGEGYSGPVRAKLDLLKLAYWLGGGVALALLSFMAAGRLGWWGLLGVPALAGLVLLWLKRGSIRRRLDNPWPGLLRLCHGDQALAGRLVDGELRRNPGLDRDGATRTALARLQRDRQR